MRWKTKDKPFSGRRDSFVSLSLSSNLNVSPILGKMKLGLLRAPAASQNSNHLEEKSILQLWDLLVLEETLYFNQGTVSPLILKKDPTPMKL